MTWAALGAVLAARLLYLARYGWDIGWMNLGYLDHARQLALGEARAAEEQPLAYYALVAARRLGLSALGANEAVYLVAHLLLAAGAVGIARFVWQEPTRRRQAILVATLALVPLLASQSGRNNLGVTLAAGLTACALAAGARASTARDAGGRAVLAVLAALLAALAASARYEALATCLGAAAVLAWFGPRMPQVVAPRRAALALGVGALGGLVAVFALRRALSGGATAGDPTYAFYTFFDGLPLLMHPELPGTEYGRYRASVRYFGGFDANHGSLVHALLHHPGWAVLRVVTKPVDLLLVLLWLYGLTPVGVALAVAGARKLGSWRGWGRGWLLAAYLLPLGMLFVPQQNPAYYVSIAVPLVLAITRGVDRLADRLSPRAARALAGLTVAGALALIAFAGKLSVTNSRALNAAAPVLEARCANGCLTNVLPQSLRDQAWVVTDAGAPFPPRLHRNERLIFGGLAGIDPAAYDFCGRVRRARAAGFRGPVLIVDARIQSFKVFDADFDPEVRYQGTFDHGQAVEEQVLRSGPDTVVVSHLAPDRPCR
ncbi:MAG TPA: hypothetical protein VN962_09210 [Polyangia bacterium]|nr:hypothetical protein [Polyangia bacterium]